MNFWDFLWLLLIWTPLALLWGIALADITRRNDIKGWMKALWAVVVLLLPFVGTLIYLFARSTGLAEPARVTHQHPAETHAQQLALLADLRDRGALSPEVYETEKAHLLAQQHPPAVRPADIQSPRSATAS